MINSLGNRKRCVKEKKIILIETVKMSKSHQANRKSSNGRPFYGYNISSTQSNEVNQLLPTLVINTSESLIINADN